MSSVLGTVSKALLASIVARSVQCAGFSAFRPSCMCCEKCCCGMFGSEAVLSV